MTKARDLANAGTALTSVSATELGYLDGVTSAIQTQIDSKIGSASAINPTIVDAKGDIIAATAADTVARLAVGSNDQVLTADSSTATGLKWAASGLTYTTWTATLTQLTQGNGTVTARYAQSGKFVTGSFKLSFGSTTTITAGGGIAFSLPVTAKATYVCTATVTFLRTGVGYESGMAAQDTTTQIFIGALKTSTNYGEYAELSSTVPHTWGNGDFISVNFVYEAA